MRLNFLALCADARQRLATLAKATLVAAGLMTVSAPALAQPDYQIEVVIFSHNGDSTLDDEYWESTLDVPTPRKVSRLYPSQSQANNFLQAPESSYQLKEQAERIRRSSKYTLLYHTAWQQKVENTNSPTSIHIVSGDLMDNGMYELEGYIAVSRGRYLHFRPNLFYSKRLTDYQASLLKKATPAPALVNDDSMTSDNGVALSDAAYSAPSALTPALIDPMELDIPDFIAAEISQGRRMRSKETHYIDHPLVGILVHAIPLN